MTVLAGKQQGVERGGRSLLAKVRKLQDDLEGVSVTMDRHGSHAQSETNKWTLRRRRSGYLALFSRPNCHREHRSPENRYSPDCECEAP